jgi:hypothetical protein
MKIYLRAFLPLVYFGCIVSIISSCGPKTRIETIAFAKDNSSISDSEKTVRSFKQYKELNVLTQFGSYDEKMNWLNDFLLSSVNKDSVDTPKKRARQKRMCSIFFTTNSSGATFHCQNLDNPKSAILVGSYSAPGKYKSVALTRMTDISYFPPNFDFNEITEMQKTFLPFFAFYPADGINECGLSVSIAGSYPHKVLETKNRKGVFITYLNRLMLDSCKNVEEALAFASKYYFFDHEGLIATNHLLIADKFGNSAILEYDKDGKMQSFFKKNDNLVMTNDDIIGVDSSQIKCVRYKAICKQLAGEPVRKYTDCMNILRTVENKTLWSVVMDNKTSTGYIAIGGQFNRYYKFKLD